MGIRPVWLNALGVKGSPLVIQYAAGYDGSSVGAVTEGRRSLRRHPLPSFFDHHQGRSGAAGAPITRALLAGEPPSQLCGVPPTVWRGPRCDRDAAASDRLGAQTAAANPDYECHCTSRGTSFVGRRVPAAP
ncbi:hypothetical protein MTO96_006923 [Rhipicephalus appendiculatus]